MPALTHNRVKNGFNGALRKNNASMGIKVSRTQGAVGADSLRKKALVGGIGSSSNHIRAAYKRRVLCSCQPKIDVTKPKIFAVTQIANPTTDQTPSFDFSSNEVGTITSNYQFTSTTAAVVGNNTITFSNLVGGTYSDVFVQVTDSVGNVSDKLILDTFVVNDIVLPTLVAKTQITTPTSDSTPSFVFTSSEVGTITSSITLASTPDAIAGDNTITFNTLIDGIYSGVTVQVTDAAGNVSNVLTLDDFTVDANTECLTLNTLVNIVNSAGNKYVFNGGTAYDSTKKYGLNIATYTFKVPEAHPIALLNNGNASIAYAAIANSGAPIIIKVRGGNTSESSGDYYTFEDENNNAINIGNGTFRFMRGKTYKFEANGISTSHPFKVSMSSAFVNDNNGSDTGISGSSGSITITIPKNHSTAAGGLYYQCRFHSDMKKDLSLFYKSVTGSTNDSSYDFFYGDVVVTVSGDFGNVSTYCYYHGYMGGENLLKYKSTCTP